MSKVIPQMTAPLSQEIINKEVKSVSDDEISEFKTHCIEKEGWTLSSVQSNCDVLFTTTSNSYNIALRVECRDTFKEIPPEVIWDVVTNPEHFSEWDTHMIDYAVIGKLDSRTQVTYYSVATPFPLWYRDWTLRRCESVDREAGEYVAFSSSVQLSERPPRNKFVRANCFMTGFYIRRSKDGMGSEVTYYAHNDFAGYIPVSIVNWTAKSITHSVIDALYKASMKLIEKNGIVAQSPPPPMSNA